MRKLKKKHHHIYFIIVGVLLLLIIFKLEFPKSSSSIPKDVLDSVKDCKDLIALCTLDNSSRYTDCSGEYPKCKCGLEDSTTCAKKESTAEEDKEYEESIAQARKDAEERKKNMVSEDSESGETAPTGSCEAYKNQGDCEKGSCDLGTKCSWSFNEKKCVCQERGDCRTKACDDREGAHCEYDSCGGGYFHQLSGDVSCKSELKDSSAVCCCKV